ncbi:hypothetical protein K458DRAFT_51701 [Lentithecium fluviatile CBS 122367]|uniref:Ubiquitin 3 binding protein But2 C-terminal domain-containing protein n=1 Tax=Lentithecium fluviatile CBS 122367 TaxID=1168545 RepID=A0A6G1IYL2_9PLEO|nr:hypothetical protein K458DRAFT_51701 [Lentithecium fluviatile CBS 122367]
MKTASLVLSLFFATTLATPNLRRTNYQYVNNTRAYHPLTVPIVLENEVAGTYHTAYIPVNNQTYTLAQLYGDGPLNKESKGFVLGTIAYPGQFFDENVTCSIETNEKPKPTRFVMGSRTEVLNLDLDEFAKVETDMTHFTVRCLLLSTST